MHAIRMQTEIGREISETGIVPEFVYLGQFWDGDKPLFEDVDIDLDELPDGTVLRVTYTTFDRNPWYFRKEPSNTGEPWVKLDREGEEYPRIDRSGVCSPASPSTSTHGARQRSLTTKSTRWWGLAYMDTHLVAPSFTVWTQETLTSC